ncbi:phenylacetate--CoA ligase family protein [Cellulosilyticum ruminicola]|uniref:phenylacetate--CoA ligase family protein n=1 Tax=Cellulosilyticum ruminicola TaxID=425254 RepID=UPI0006D26071|nr:phenylacetate--CoA ligase family protein [Cellulosilyticum ruminicola]
MNSWLKDHEKQLKKLFTFLNENNAFYKTIFETQKIDLSAPIEEIFYRLPIITKKEVRQHYEDYISNMPVPTFSELTSGSTGIPVKCVKTNSERTKLGLNVWQQRARWDSEVSLENYIYLYDVSTYKKIGNILNFEIENMKVCFKKLLALKPRWISGPISSFERYAKCIEMGEIEYTPGIIKYLELFGEYATQEQRAYVERIFEAKTINHYGTIESWCFAYECPSGHLHVQNNLFFAEQLPTQNKLGESVGEIVLTSLFNKAMPLIRYNLQDLGEISDVACECGQTSQVIRLAGGRTGDIIKGTDDVLGELFFKRGIYKVIQNFGDCILGYHVDQMAVNTFVISIEKGKGYNSQAELILKNHIVRGLGKDVEVIFKYVDILKPLQSGKMKIFTSHVKDK